MEEPMELASNLLRLRPVAAAWLFGSRARGSASANSDHDIAILPSSALPAEQRFSLRLDLTVSFSRALETDRIDVVLADEVSPLLAHRILKDGILIYRSDDVQRVRFEVRALREYFDTRPLDREYFSHLALRYRRGSARG